MYWRKTSFEYQMICGNIFKFDKFLRICYSKLKKIFNIVGKSDIFLQLSSSVVNKTLVFIVNNLNRELASTSQIFLKTNIEVSIEMIHIMLSIEVYNSISENLKINIDIIWKIAIELNVSTLSRKQKYINKIQEAEFELDKIYKKQFSENFLKSAKFELESIKEFQLFRQKEKKEKQIKYQKIVIDGIIKDAEKAKKIEIHKQKEQIVKLKKELENLE